MSKKYKVKEIDDKIYPRIFQMVENARKEIVVVISGLTFIRVVQVEIDKLVFGKAKESFAQHFPFWKQAFGFLS